MSNLLDKMKKVLGKKKKKHFDWPPRCYKCNEYMSYRQLSRAITWAFYGSTTDLEPPENEVIHRKCWIKLGKKGQLSIRKISWMGPYDKLKNKDV